MGALVAAFVGYSVTGLPWIIHMPLTFLAGALAGAVWGGIPGLLKARTGAHEVINTMMMNYVAFNLAHYLLNGPMKRGGEAGFIPISRDILDSAPTSPILSRPDPASSPGSSSRSWWQHWCAGSSGRPHWDSRFARWAQSPRGALCRDQRDPQLHPGHGDLRRACGHGRRRRSDGGQPQRGEGFSPGYGFDSIALALLGGGHPLGVVLAALLFGTLRNGATKMQSLASIPIDIISIVQAFVIMFVAAPAIIRWIYRIKAEGLATGDLHARMGRLGPWR